MSDVSYISVSFSLFKNTLPNRELLKLWYNIHEKMRCEFQGILKNETVKWWNLNNRIFSLTYIIQKTMQIMSN